ncbi:MAG: hypothetical protein RIE56_03210 [Amphiplicatus sp.]
MKQLMIMTASAAALASAAFAQSIDETAATPQYTPETMPVEHTAFDALSVTTKEEAKAFAKAEFAMIDINADAKIEKSEFIAAAEAAHAKAETAMNETTQATNDMSTTVTAEATVDAEGQIAEGDTDVETAEQQFIGLAQDENTVSEKQLIDARVADFEAADVNGDGKLEGVEQDSFANSVKFGIVA